MVRKITGFSYHFQSGIAVAEPPAGGAARVTMNIVNSIMSHGPSEYDFQSVFSSLGHKVTA